MDGRRFVKRLPGLARTRRVLLSLVPFLLSILLPGPVHALEKQDLPHLSEVLAELARGPGKSRDFWILMDYNPDAAPSELRKRYRDALFYPVSGRAPRRLYLAFDRRKVERELGRPVDGERLILRARLDPDVLREVRPMRLGVLTVSEFARFYNHRPWPVYAAETGRSFDPSGYAPSTQAKVKANLWPLEGEPVRLDLVVERVQGLSADLARPMSLQSGEWRVIRPTAHEGAVVFLLAHQSQRELYKADERLRPDQSIRVWGRVGPLYNPGGEDQPLLLVDRLEIRSGPPDANDAPASTGDDPWVETAPAASAPGAEEAGERSYTRVRARALLSQAAELLDQSVELLHVYRGVTRLPGTIVDEVPPLAGRSFDVLRNRRTDLEGVFLVYNRRRDGSRLRRVLDTLETGDTVLLRGEVRRHEERVFLVVREAVALEELSGGRR